MSKLILILAIMVSLYGCMETTHTESLKYTCSEEQLVMVEREIKICRDSRYLATHCYDIAKIAHCSLREDET
jgi:hypothetical protein